MDGQRLKAQNSDRSPQRYRGEGNGARFLNLLSAVVAGRGSYTATAVNRDQTDRDTNWTGVYGRAGDDAYGPVVTRDDTQEEGDY